jgi:hypothetical protein
MPADQRNNEVASNTVGGRKPQPTPKSRLAAAHHIKASAIAPYVLRVLPEHGSPPLSASELFRVVNFGCIGTLRLLLTSMVKANLATATIVPSKVGGEKKVYTRAPAIVPDDFENSPHVYGDAVE